MTVLGKDMQSGSTVSEGQEMHQISRRDARKQKRQLKMDEWKKDMDAFNRRYRKDEALASFVDSIAGVQAQAAVVNMGFVLEADYVTFRRGERVMVNSGTTFVSLNGERAVVQISPSMYRSGPNGIGGVTVVGNATNVKTVKTPKGEVVFSMNVSGIGINANVEIRVYEGSGRAYATVTPNFNSNTVRLEGQIVPYGQSRVVEGMSL